MPLPWTRFAVAYDHPIEPLVTDDITHARVLAGLTVDQSITLCGVSRRTWYRWTSSQAPTWALRVLLSYRGTLDRLGWKDWEIRGGRLYCNQLAHCYWWEPFHLILPLYGVNPYPDLDSQLTDRLSLRALEGVANVVE